MALDRIYADTVLTRKLPTASGLKAGAPYVVGKIPCVLLTDAETAAPYNATVQVDGVFNLTAQAEGSDIAIGDKIYYDSDDATKLTNSAGGDPVFGYALQALTQANSPATIQVAVGVRS